MQKIFFGMFFKKSMLSPPPLTFFDTLSLGKHANASLDNKSWKNIDQRKLNFGLTGQWRA